MGEVEINISQVDANLEYLQVLCNHRPELLTPVYCEINYIIFEKFYSVSTYYFLLLEK